MTLTLEAMLSDKAQWPQAAALIKSGQIPEPRMAEIARDHPEFWNTVMGTEGSDAL